VIFVSKRLVHILSIYCPFSCRFGFYADATIFGAKRRKKKEKKIFSNSWNSKVKKHSSPTKNPKITFDNSALDFPSRVDNSDLYPLLYHYLPYDS